MAALMWISHSERPLRADELCHALAVEIGSPDLNADDIPSIGTLLACCQGLFVVDTEVSTVRLIHFTLQEYLQAHPDLFGATHSTITETCLSYLNSQQVKAFSTSPSHNPQDTPFLEYSSMYWGVHAKRDLSDRAKLLALKLFDGYINPISTKIILRAQKPYLYAADFDKLSLFSGLHCASFFGIVEIVAGLVEMEGCDINKMDCDGNTPLTWAAWNGHEGVVELLLGQDGISPETSDKSGRTPLHRAAWNGHERVVEILLEQDCIDPRKPNTFGQTPLHLAAWNGHEGVVKVLLGGHDVNPNKPDMLGRTPLHMAAENGRGGVVKTLLERENVKLNELDMRGGTPLFYATENEHRGVVALLQPPESASLSPA